MTANDVVYVPVPRMSEKEFASFVRRPVFWHHRTKSRRRVPGLCDALVNGRSTKWAYAIFSIFGFGCVWEIATNAEGRPVLGRNSKPIKKIRWGRVALKRKH